MKQKLLVFMLMLFLVSCTPEADLTTPSTVVVPTAISEASPTSEMIETIVPTTTPEDVEIFTTPTEVVAEETIIIGGAQEFPFQTTYAIGLGDLDGDGDLDAVFANMKFNDSGVWLNDGAGNFEQTDQELTQQGHGVGLADLDGDGDLDAVITCAGYNGQSKPTKIYFNDGRGNFTDSTQDLGDLVLSGNEVNLLDVENDGDMDIHVYYYPGSNKIYLNDGHGGFSEGVDLMLGDVEWGDMNADGFVDVFVKDYENEKFYRAFLNDGSGSFVESWQMQDANITYGEMLLGDYDSDGDLDAFITNGDRSVQHPSFILLNQGDGTFEDNGQRLEITTLSHLVQGDLTGDGYLDIFVSNGWATDRILVNDGRGFFIDSGLVLDENKHSTIPSLGDLDGDGDLDIMVGSYESQLDYWFNETGANSTASSHQYLGQTPPGDEPEIFAPGIVSQVDHFEHSSIYFTPDLNEAFWISDYQSNPENRELLFVSYENGEWISPEAATFREHYAAASVSFSPDGNRLYFSSVGPLTEEERKDDLDYWMLDSDIWYVDKINNHWSEPVHIDSGINSENEEQLGVVLENGTIYFHDYYNIFRSEMKDGEYLPPEKLGDPINTRHMDLEPYVPDDESYILFSSTRPGGYGGADIYISFKGDDGNWTELINLGRTINSFGNDRMPIVSPDGKYLFFFSVRGESSDIYWISASFIDALSNHPETISPSP